MQSKKEKTHLVVSVTSQLFSKRNNAEKASSFLIALWSKVSPIESLILISALCWTRVVANEAFCDRSAKSKGNSSFSPQTLTMSLN